MESLFIFNLKRSGRALVAPALGVLAVAIMLLGVGSELPTASASTLPPTRPENVTAAITYYTYLPVIFRSLVSAVGYSDHFTSDSSGWTTDGSDCDGEYDEADSVYRVTIDHAGKSCIVWNANLQRQFYGTFYVKARRTSTSADVRYGIQFDSAANSTDGSGTRWALEVYPKNSSGCKNLPFYWLQAIKSGSLEFTNANGDDECIDDILDLEKGHYNQLAAVRNGRTVDVYIKGDHEFHEDFKSVYQFASNEADKYGYFQMRVVSGSSVPVQVEFDEIKVLGTVTAPW